MQSSFRLGKIFGVEVDVHWSWFLVLLLMSWFLEGSVVEDHFPAWTAAQRWGMSVIMAILVFVSVVLHELSHALMARRLGLPVANITLFIFGGVTNLLREPQTPEEEFRVTVVGPITSLALGLIWSAVFFAVWQGPWGEAEMVVVVAAYTAIINGMLGAFNLLPGFPLDGGRILRSSIWRRNKRNFLEASRVAKVIGASLAYGLVVVGLVMTVTVSLASGLWFMVVGWFLRNASESAYERAELRDRLRRVSISLLIRTSFDWVSPNTTPLQLVNRHVVRQGPGQRCFPVMDESQGELLGLVTLTDIQRVKEEEFDKILVKDVMASGEKLMKVSPGQNAFQALEIMAKGDVHQLPVLTNGKLMGFITRGDILKSLADEG